MIEEKTKMIVVINHTARQFNLKTVDGDKRVTVRIIPGYNEVPENIWKAFDDGKRIDPYVSGLQKNKQLDWGKGVEEKAFDDNAEPVLSKTKSIKPPKKPKK